jgi:DNA-damage-inducible protein D
MNLSRAVALFEQKEIGRTWYQNKWWFSVTDVVQILTDSDDVKQYIKKMRTRDAELSVNWGTICTPLDMIAKDGKQRMIVCSSVEGILRIIQSIPSPKAEPFKQWLARIGKERLEEIENPELAMERMKSLYEKKGYPKEWVDKRVRGIAVRQDLTQEWRNRGAANSDYAILTNEIMKGTFELNVQEYKNVKGLHRENLRDHMNDIELILTMLGEATTTKITRDRDSRGVPKLRKDAKDGGAVAGRTRKDIELQSGRKVVSEENFLEKIDDKKRLPRAG